MEPGRNGDYSSLSHQVLKRKTDGFFFSPLKEIIACNGSKGKNYFFGCANHFICYSQRAETSQPVSQNTGFKEVLQLQFLLPCENQQGIAQVCQALCLEGK